MTKKQKAKVAVASRGFKRGFWRGASAHMWTFMAPHVVRTRRFDVSVERAWSDVGRILTDVTRTEGARIDEETNTSTGKTKLPA